MSTPEKDLVYNRKQADLKNKNQYANGGWLHSPAMLQLFSRSLKYLIELNRKRGVDSMWVPYVRAARPRNQDIVYIYPTDERDEDKLEVKKRDSHAFINVRSLLEESHHTVEWGYRVRFEIVPAGEDSPVGPALMFDLSKPVERKQQPPSVLKPKRKPKAKKQPPGSGENTSAR